MAELYATPGRYTEAERFCERAFAVLEKTPCDDHFRVVDICDDIVELCRQLGKEDEAEGEKVQLYILDKIIGGS